MSVIPFHWLSLAQHSPSLFDMTFSCSSQGFDPLFLDLASLKSLIKMPRLAVCRPIIILSRWGVPSKLPRSGGLSRWPQNCQHVAKKVWIKLPRPSVLMVLFKSTSYWQESPSVMLHVNLLWDGHNICYVGIYLFFTHSTLHVRTCVSSLAWVVELYWIELLKINH